MIRKGTAEVASVADTASTVTYLLSVVILPFATQVSSREETWSTVGALREVTQPSSKATGGSCHASDPPPDTWRSYW